MDLTEVVAYYRVPEKPDPAWPWNWANEALSVWIKEADALGWDARDFSVVSVPANSDGVAAVVEFEGSRFQLKAADEAGNHGVEVRAYPMPAADAEERFPQLAYCRFCGRILRRNKAEDRWTNYGIAGTTNTECDKAPNPDDGPMPKHEPRPPILTESDDPLVPAPYVLPQPVIPQIPRM